MPLFRCYPTLCLSFLPRFIAPARGDNKRKDRDHIQQGRQSGDNVDTRCEQQSGAEVGNPSSTISEGLCVLNTAWDWSEGAERKTVYH
ncbi:hypothetical protein ACOMHN_003387 [Nucella lapillus]